ncbi:MAG: NAD(P)-binding domain-containing protein [Acidobacteria bacterium]|nr:NAD(P)-binding domain-containing protein [Acidobacteriota bacterium]
MKIGIIGSGGVAKTLAGGFLANGHQVTLGTRDAEKLADWLAAAGENAAVGSFAETARFGDVVFLCVRGEAAVDAVALAGAENLAGKTLIDPTNPLDFSNGVPPKFAAAVGDSLGERVQRAAPDARVVKAFNAIGAAIMVDPRFGDDRATMFIAGDDDRAKKETAALAAEFGWDVEDLGGIDQSFFLEAFASLWINYGFKNNHWTHAFKFLKR